MSGVTPKKHVNFGDDILVSKSRQEMQDLVKAKQEMEYLMRQAMGMTEPIFTYQDLKEHIQKTKQTIDDAQRQLEELYKIIEYVDALPFKEGDAAFHKDHGNVLVGGLVLNKVIENSCYSITTKTGKRCNVPFDSLMPITEATKVLYGRK